MNTESRKPSKGHLPSNRSNPCSPSGAKEQTRTDLETLRSGDFRTINGVSVPAASNIDQRIAMVIELMISSPSKAISVDAVAALLNLSPSRLRHLFKEQVGIPFHKYEVLLRLERVRLLLRTTDCSVKETARMLGFVDMSNFTHMFKRTYGITPGAVRAVRE